MSEQAAPERVKVTVTNLTEGRKVLNSQTVPDLSRPWIEPGERQEDIVMLRTEYEVAERTQWFAFEDLEVFTD